MTRIIAGAAGGRRLVTPDGPHTRPTTDRVREALFSRLEHDDVIEGARVVDLYAGSGALGLEAASRGAARVDLVEDAPRAVAAIATNIDDLGLGGVAAIARERVATFLGRGPGAGGVAHLVLSDPPYPLDEASLTRDLVLLVDRGWLGEGAVVVVERSSRSPEPAWPPGLRRFRSKRYGETMLWYAEPDGPSSGMISAMSEIVIPRPVSGDIVDVILADHRLLEDLLRELRDATADREGARTAIADLLVAHGEAEEGTAYPSLRRETSMTEHEVEHGEEEHAQINEALLALLQCKGTDTQKFDDAVEELAKVLNHHVTEEELTILNPAREEVSESERAELGSQWLAERSRLLDERPGTEERVAALVKQAYKEGHLPAEEEE